MANARNHWMRVTTPKVRRRSRCGLCSELTDSSLYINDILICETCESTPRHTNDPDETCFCEKCLRADRGGM